MHRSIPIFAAGLLGLTAGWFLHTDFSKPPEKKSAIAAAPVAASVKPAAAASPAGVTAAWTGTGANASPAPFTSLEELIAMVGDIDTSDELSMVELMTGIPRLLCTDLPATRCLLAELDASERPEGEARGVLAMSLLARWMMQEPEGAIDFGRSHPAIFGDSPDSDTMQSFAMMGVMMMAKKNPESARNLVEMLPEDQKEEAGEMLKMLEASHDPEAALKALPPDKRGDAAPIVALWAKRDPQAAVRWVALQPADEREELIKAAAGSWAKKDWKGAAQWAANFTPESARAAVYSEIATSIPNGSSEVAKNETALAGLPPALADRIRLAAIHGVSEGDEGQTTATAIGEILKRNANDEGIQSAAGSAVQDVVKALAGNDGKAAAEWVQSLPSGSAKESATVTLVGEWADNDAAAAAAWVATLPPGDTREKATAGLIDKIAGSDPEHALEWAKSLTDAAQRTEQIGKVMREWLPENPFAAMKALQALPLEMRAEIWDGVEQ